MDHATKERLCHHIRELERELEAERAELVRMWLANINLLLLADPAQEHTGGAEHPSRFVPLPPDPSKSYPGQPTMPSLDFLPGWLSHVVQDKGLRVPYLQRALHMRKIVIAPKFGKVYGLQIKGEW